MFGSMLDVAILKQLSRWSSVNPERYDDFVYFIREKNCLHSKDVKLNSDIILCGKLTKSRNLSLGRCFE